MLPLIIIAGDLFQERGSILWFPTGGPNNTHNQHASRNTCNSLFLNKKNSLYRIL